MDLVRRHLLEPLEEMTSSLPVVWRVLIVLGPFLLLAFLLTPLILNLAGLIVASVLHVMVRGYAWIEYQIVRVVRHFGRHPTAFLTTLDDGMEAVALGGGRMARTAARSRPLRRATRAAILTVAVLPVACFYLAPLTEPGTETRAKFVRGVAWSVAFDAWIRTGVWPQQKDEVRKKKPKPAKKSSEQIRPSRTSP